MLKPADDMMSACNEVLENLESYGLSRADLPGNGDLKDAIETAGYTLATEEE